MNRDALVGLCTSPPNNLLLIVARAGKKIYLDSTGLAVKDIVDYYSGTFEVHSIEIYVTVQYVFFGYLNAAPTWLATIPK